MRLEIILLLVTCVNVKYVGTQIIEIPGSDDENHDAQTTEKNLVDHTFVALIDIVFTDNSKRTCTGSIIHDNVVITAAHCFTKEMNRSVKPELTASFVVIGTKKMFDTGYEQYLPIERVITHPRFRGWTADLSLVYTFAAMTSDKPGTIISLAGEKTSTHVDSNVTVLSWGHMKDIDSQKDWVPSKTEKCDSSSLEDYNKDEVQTDNDKTKVTAILQAKIRHRSNFDTSDSLIYKETFLKERDFLRDKSRGRVKTRNKPPRSQKTKLISRYLSGEERVKTTTKSRHIHRHRNIKRNQTLLKDDELMIYDEETTAPNQDIFRHNHSVTHIDSEYGFKSYYKNWRRQMGSQQNQLMVEIFGFVNVLACKKLVEKAMPARYDISDGNDVVCYAAEDHFISDEDSGAPAVRRGQLIAVTVGGAEIDGDHVAVGMKMSCYCNWIADNLPNGGSHLQCCKNCCDVKHKEEYKDPTYKYKNKYLI